jgi:hypothetical protein
MVIHSYADFGVTVNPITKDPVFLVTGLLLFHPRDLALCLSLIKPTPFQVFPPPLDLSDIINNTYDNVFFTILCSVTCDRR